MWGLAAASGQNVLCFALSVGKTREECDDEPEAAVLCMARDTDSD